MLVCNTSVVLFFVGLEALFPMPSILIGGQLVEVLPSSQPFSIMFEPGFGPGSKRDDVSEWIILARQDAINSSH